EPHVLEIDSEGVAWLDQYATAIPRYSTPFSVSNRYLHIERTTSGFWISSDPLGRTFSQPVQLKPRRWQAVEKYGISGRPGPVREIKDMQVGECGYEVP